MSNDLEKLDDHLKAAKEALEKVEEWKITALEEIRAAEKRLENLDKKTGGSSED